MTRSVAVVPLPFSALAQVERLAAVAFETRWERTAFAYFLTARDARNVAVFGADGDLWGYAITLFAAGNLDVVSVAVVPERRRQGLAAILLDALRGQLDVVSSTLEVRADNVPALKLYEKLGYAVVGIRRRYYDGKTDATVMRWDRKR